MLTEVILLERIEKLGKMGELVRVRPGYARNFLLPQKKALRATKENIAYFEAQRHALEGLNAERRSEAEKLAKKLDKYKVVILRQASESGQLYGSVSSRDIADALTETSGEAIHRNQVDMNSALKAIGLFPIKISLHPEVKIEITLNIARSLEEAKTQEKTGKAAIIDHNAEPSRPAAEQKPEEEAKGEAEAA